MERLWRLRKVEMIWAHLAHTYGKVMETSRVGGSQRLTPKKHRRFDRLTPSNLEEKGKMTWRAPSATYIDVART